MAENDNTITLVGRIGQEPELRGTSKGEVCSFTLATSERRRLADDSWSEGPTSWFRVSAWGDLARHAHASLHRGQQVIVRGIVSVKEFQLEAGGRSKSIEVRATALGHDLRWGTTTFVDGGRQGAVPAPAPQRTDELRSAEQQSVEPRPIGSEHETAGEPREPVPAGVAAPGGDWGSGLGAEDAPF